MIEFDVDWPQDCFDQEVNWMPAIREQLSTLTVLYLDRMHHLPHAPLQEMDTYSLTEEDQSIPNALHRIQCGGDYKDLLCGLVLIEYNGIWLSRLVLEPGTGLSE